jgi:gluconolactonase
VAKIEPAQAWQQDRTIIRFPDPAIEIVDERFRQLLVGQGVVERLWTGGRWLEGPVWFGDGRYLLFSDIPNNRMLRWIEETGEVTVFRQPADNSNGNTRDRQGRLITCEHSGRRLTRTETDGAITVLIDTFDGKRLNGTNDVVVKSDDTIWFTDPPSGIAGNYLGIKAQAELPFDVYRLDPASGRATVVTTGLIKRPNGLAFSPDETKLYVVESAAEGRAIYTFDLTDGGTRLANGRVLIACEKDETPDGFRVDVDGNLWCGWGMGGPGLDGVKVFDPNGRPIGFIALPERCANVCFGGVKRNRLFMTASHSVYSLYVNTQGVKGG